MDFEKTKTTYYTTFKTDINKSGLSFFDFQEIESENKIPTCGNSALDGFFAPKGDFENFLIAFEWFAFLCYHWPLGYRTSFSSQVTAVIR